MIARKGNARGATFCGGAWAAPEGREKIGGNLAVRPRHRPGRHPATVAPSSNCYDFRHRGRGNNAVKCGRFGIGLGAAPVRLTGSRHESPASWRVRASRAPVSAHRGRLDAGRLSVPAARSRRRVAGSPKCDRASVELALFRGRCPERQPGHVKARVHGRRLPSSGKTRQQQDRLTRKQWDEPGQGHLSPVSRASALPPGAPTPGPRLLQIIPRG